MRLPQPEHSTAILIGVAGYEDEALPDIPAAANNVTDLAATLTDPRIGGFLPDNVHALVDPTHTEAGRRLARLCRNADDVLLVYFAGHGLIGKDGELLLAVSDTEEDLPGVSSLAIGQVREAIADSPAPIRILILDCCFSGRAVSTMSSTGDSALLGQVDLEGTYTLTSASRNLPALFVPGARHTVFSGELITVLSEGVPDGKPLLSLGTTHTHLSRRLRRGNHPVPKVLHSDSASELALVRNRSYAQESSPPPSEPAPPPPRISLTAADLQAAIDSMSPPQSPPRARSLADADAVVRDNVGSALGLTHLESEAADPSWPILARLRFACALITSDYPAQQALRELGSSDPRSAGTTIASLLRSLRTDSSLVRFAGSRWDLDGLLASPHADPEPTEVWGTAMAMLLDAAELPFSLCAKAITELAELGYPEQAARIAEGMLRDRWLDEAASATYSQLILERQ